MADRPAPKARRATKLVVRDTAWVTPHLIRTVSTPADPADFERLRTPHTDAYVKVVFRPPGVSYPEPFDMAQVRQLSREQWPALRTYTLREVRPDTGEVVIDFVYHGDAGLAGPWAADLEPGDEMLVLGPGGAYHPDPAADWHLFAGDESALPAITAALAQVPAGVPVYAFVEVADAGEELPLDTPGALQPHWLHRGSGGNVVDAVRALDWPAGQVHAFVHGEAGQVKQLRRHLLGERGLSLEQLSISGYWRRGFDDEAYREAKQAERDAEEALTGVK